MTVWLWPVLLLLVALLVVLDLGILTRRPRVVTPTEASATTLLWLLAAVVFSFVIAYVYEVNWLKIEETVSFPLEGGPLNGTQALWQFFTSYVLEIALSLDNLAVIALVYAAFGIPKPLIGRALFWSILVAMAVRLGMISGGAWLIVNWPSVRWVLGAMIVLAMLRTLVLPDARTDLSRTWYSRVVRSCFRIRETQDRQRLFTKADEGGTLKLCGTPMLGAVLVAALLDTTFALDSVPALFSVTKDPFLAFSASLLAGLGLRSLYFTIAELLPRFRFLRVSVVFILLFVAAKMFLTDHAPKLTPLVTLAFVSGTMGLGVLASVLWWRARIKAHPEFAPRPTPLEDLSEAVELGKRNARKIGILITGTVIVLFGIAIAPLPGPGPTVLVPIGLALLATEFVWARWVLDKVKSGAFNVADRADAIADRVGVWCVPALFVAHWVIGLLLVRLMERILTAFSKDHEPVHFAWYTIAVIVGSPFMPVLLWGTHYIRKWWKRRAEARSTRTSAAGSTPLSSETGSNKDAA